MRDARHEALWRRVEARLDARQDPLEDPELARELAALPELFAATTRVRRRLAALSAVPLTASGVTSERTTAPTTARTAPGRRRVHAVTSSGAPQQAPRSLRLLAGGAVAAGLGLVLLAFWREGQEPARDHVPGTVYSATVVADVQRPVPPRAALVTHEPRRIVGWTFPGEPR